MYINRQYIFKLSAQHMTNNYIQFLPLVYIAINDIFIINISNLFRCCMGVRKIHILLPCERCDLPRIYMYKSRADRSQIRQSEIGCSIFCQLKCTRRVNRIISFIYFKSIHPTISSNTNMYDMELLYTFY